jgi:hypothetical protein
VNVAKKIISFTWSDKEDIIIIFKCPRPFKSRKFSFSNVSVNRKDLNNHFCAVKDRWENRQIQKVKEET